MDLNVGRLVWARRNQNDVYWPGTIKMISNNNDSWSSDLFDSFQQQSNYLIEFFITNQSIWTTDILPYHQYRDSMTNESFIHYGLHPAIKQDFLNSIHQADYIWSNEMYVNSNHSTAISTMTSSQQQQNFASAMENNTDNGYLLTSSQMLTSNTGR